MGKIKAKFYKAVLALEMFCKAPFSEHNNSKLRQDGDSDGIVNDYAEDKDVETYMAESELWQLNEMKTRLED